MPPGKKLPGKKLPGPEEVGVPVARSMVGTGPKLSNGTAPPKLPTGFPSPKLPLRATHSATALPKEAAQKPKKPISCPQLPPAPRAAQGSCNTSNASGAKAGLSRQSSWETKQPPTSSKLPLEPSSSQEPGDSEENTRTLEKDSCGSSADSPVHGTPGKLAKASQKAKSKTSSFCTSQETDCGTDLPAGPGTELDASKDSKLAKPKSSLLANAALEPGSTVSPPPAKKLALSAKKVSLSFCLESSVGIFVPSQLELVLGASVELMLGVLLSWRWVGRAPQPQGCKQLLCSRSGSGCGARPLLLFASLSDAGEMAPAFFLRTEGWLCQSLRRGGLPSILGIACPLGRVGAGDAATGGLRSCLLPGQWCGTSPLGAAVQPGLGTVLWGFCSLNFLPSFFPLCF